MQVSRNAKPEAAGAFKVTVSVAVWLPVIEDGEMASACRRSGELVRAALFTTLPCLADTVYCVVTPTVSGAKLKVPLRAPPATRTPTRTPPSSG